MSEDEAGVSDWEEQDLLTIDLAAGRLAAEIESLRRQMADHAGSEIDLTDTKARLELLEAAGRRLGLAAP